MRVSSLPPSVFQLDVFVRCVCVCVCVRACVWVCMRAGMRARVCARVCARARKHVVQRIVAIVDMASSAAVRFVFSVCLGDDVA